MEYIEMRTFLQEQNKTHEEMDHIWNYCLEKGHKKILQLDRSGMTWHDLNTMALKTLEREYLKLVDNNQ